MSTLNTIHSGYTTSDTTGKQPLTMANDVEATTTQLADTMEHDVSRNDVNRIVPNNKKIGTKRSDTKIEELYQNALALFKVGHPVEAVASKIGVSSGYALKLHYRAIKGEVQLPQARYDVVKSGVSLKKLVDGLFANSAQLKVTRTGNALLIEEFNPQHVGLD